MILNLVFLLVWSDRMHRRCINLEMSKICLRNVLETRDSSEKETLSLIRLLLFVLRILSISQMRYIWDATSRDKNRICSWTKSTIIVTFPSVKAPRILSAGERKERHRKKRRGTIIEKICCDYVHHRSPGGRQRGCCAERGRFGRDPEAVGEHRDDVRHRTRHLFRRHHHHPHRHHRHRLRHYCVRRRRGRMRAYLSEIRNNVSALMTSKLQSRPRISKHTATI